ncbi:MAG: N-6 DNA methylase [Hyphomicrobiales bacterium]|nr:N-6 DNA methylase [Hyphomicrobiales bacterium]
MTHPVARELRKIAGVRFFQRFYDWLELSLAAFCRDEERYMETMRRYGPLVPGKNHPADHFAAALGAVHLAMAKDNEAGVIHDHLGEIYETEGASEKEMAQFFTPMPLCQLMARMTIDETTPEDAVISDPACGSGRFFLAAIPLRPNAHFIGVDVDRTCAKMAVLNMLWRNANATIIWGQHLAADGQRRLGNEPHCSGRRGHQFWGGACPSCAGGAIQEERRPTG